MKKFGSSRNFLSKISRSTKIHKPASAAKGMRSYRNFSDNQNHNPPSGTYSDESDSVDDHASQQYEMFREMYKSGHDPSIIKSTMESAGLDPRAVLSRADLLKCKGQSYRRSRIGSMRSQGTRKSKAQKSNPRRSMKKKKRNVVKNPKFRRQPSTTEVPIVEQEESAVGAFQSGRNMSYVSARDRNISFNEVTVSDMQPSAPTSTATMKSPQFTQPKSSGNAFQNELQNTLRRRKNKEQNVNESFPATTAMPHSYQNVPPPTPPRRNTSKRGLRRAPSFKTEVTYNYEPDIPPPPPPASRVSGTYSQVTTHSRPARGFIRKEVQPGSDNRFIQSSKSHYQGDVSNSDAKSVYSKAPVRKKRSVTHLPNFRLPPSRVSGTFSQVTTNSRQARGFLRKEPNAANQNNTDAPSSRSLYHRQGSKDDVRSVYTKPSVQQNNDYESSPPSPRVRKTFLRRNNTLGTGSVASKAPPPGSLASKRRLHNRSSGATQETTKTSNRAYFRQDVSSSRGTRYNHGKPRSVGTESTDQATSAITSMRNTAIEATPVTSHTVSYQGRQEPNGNLHDDFLNSTPLGSEREKNGIPLKLFAYDSAVYKPFKAMQISGRRASEIILALEEAGLDPSALYPQGTATITADLWDLKYSKSYLQHYYQHRKTGEILWKREVDNFLREIKEKEARYGTHGAVDFGPTISDEDI